MEILTLLSSLSNSYYPRVYIVADSDIMSTEKIETFESNSDKVMNIAIKLHCSLFVLLKKIKTLFVVKPLYADK